MGNMKIAITADIHLKTRYETPERYHALENIFQQMRQMNISNLFIAGDLFDKEASNYYDFDSLCQNYPDIHITIIPGNHDPQIEKRFFTATNVEIIRKPVIKKGINGLNVLFIPYDLTRTIDEILTEFQYNNGLPERWILIGHGDYITKNKESNLYEPGVYMPISSKIINKYNPLRVILGHIHIYSEFGKVIYPGSPCGLDITETGKRRFIIYDTERDIVETRFVQTDILYFIESILIFPNIDEIEFLRKKLKQTIENWGLTPEELKKVKLRLIMKGYTKNLHELKNVIINLLKEQEISLYDADSLNISEVKVIKDIDVEKFSILDKVKQKVDELNLQSFKTSKDKILEKAMELIFGE